jgi:molybdopterin molybdotransferase
MTSVQDATRIILQSTLALDTELVPFYRSNGRVLREALVADRDFPPFDRVSMDGIAILFEDFAVGQRTFPVEGIQAAGASRQKLSQANYCLEVMTGAVLPENTDTVIRYEDLEMKNGMATILTEHISKGQNIHVHGSDRRKGDMIVAEGTLITSAETGIAATIGKTHLKVARLPRVAVISTGDELVEVGEKPLPHQIRKSNVHTLAAILSIWGLHADLLHLPDQQGKIEAVLSDCLKKYEAIILSGGVSMGKFDHVPEALDRLGVHKLFHKISQRPGKPFWFGRTERTVVFAFPGNPVSTFLCMYRYFQTWLRASLGLPPFSWRYAMLEEDYFFKPDLTYFLQVKLKYREDGCITALPVTGQGSGDLANLVDADSFMELPKERQDFKKGEVLPVWVFK